MRGVDGDRSRDRGGGGGEGGGAGGVVGVEALGLVGGPEADLLQGVNAVC